MLQRTDEWFEARKGRFTASNITLLLGKEGLARTRQAIDNLAFEKAVEIVHGVEEDDNFVSFDMQRGIDLEPLAFRLFKEMKSYEFIKVSESPFYTYGDNAGASPDGETNNNKNLEIKCPRRKKFFKLVSNGIYEVEQKYIDQMQMQMLATKTVITYFFNYYVENGLQYWHEIIIPRDDERIKLIDERIIIASEIRNEYVNKLKNNAQW